MEGWADFVFDNDYRQENLSILEKHLRSEKHFPGIPSEEAAKEGVDQVEMNTTLLQKAEGLTFYVIKLQKEIDPLKTAK